jgi:4-hydroxybenzoate polyprenyltransferase
MGSAAMGYNPFVGSLSQATSENDGRIISIVAFYASNTLWAIIYDTIYAHQDIKDDSKAGVKSMAVKFGTKIKLCFPGP